MSRCILITGAGTGLGADAARELAPGNILLLHYNSSKTQAEEVAKVVEQNGGKAELYQADLSREAGCEALAHDIKARHDRLDVLINNTGGMIRRGAISAPDFNWAFMMDSFALNTFSAMRMTSLMLPLLEKGQDPNIIFITSIGNRTGGPSCTIYAATKGALDSFVRGAAKELAPRIRVNAVAPGIIETPFHEKIGTDYSIGRKNTPLGRNGVAQEISPAIRFLSEATFVTGETIDINGGLYMR